MADKDKQREAARLRKQKSRAKQKANGLEEIRIKLNATERERLAEMCQFRAGIREPYDLEEYIALLIDRDWQKGQQQKAELAARCCGKCKDPLPGGCNGLFSGDAECFHTYPNNKELRL